MQVNERRKPGAEVIQRKAQAQAGHAVHGHQHLLWLLHDRRFSQLKLQPARINAGALQQPAHGRQQPAVLELAERHVDRHMHRRHAAFLHTRQIVTGAGNHPVAHRHDQTGFLSQRDKFTGAQQPALRMAPADQPLEADNPASAQIYPRLVM